MNEQEKSLKLAELMEYSDISTDYTGYMHVVHHIKQPLRNLKLIAPWNPYDGQTFGSAQFAAILLRFPEVMWAECLIDDSTGEKGNLWDWQGADGIGLKYAPNQANILDEILRMNGVDPDA